MDAANNRKLRSRAVDLGVSLDDTQLARLERYLTLLVEWNARINLTAVTDPSQIIERHFLDSLAVVPVVRGSTSLVDVGAGAGFPGVVIGIALPELRVTSVESIRKKVAFLQTLRREVAPNLEPVCARVDEVRRAGRQFAAAVSRATWDPAEWLLEGSPLVATDGLLIAMQGSEQPDLTAPAGFAEEPPRDYLIEGAHRRLRVYRRTLHVEPSRG
jgi:16S rRNA (guanine527-N7)-methyltransferase